MVRGLAWRCLPSRSVKNACSVGAIRVMSECRVGPLTRRSLDEPRPGRAVPGRRTDTNYSDLGITGITPILGLFRCPLLPARKRPGTLDDALWQLSPVGIIPVSYTH